MKKNIYFIDTENVHNNWISLLDNSENMKIYLFYTENTPNISYDILKSLTKHIRSLNMISCQTGPNALDFQLISYLSFILNKRSRDNYIIVSNDKGFDVVIDFWNERGFTLSRLKGDALGGAETKSTNTKQVINSNNCPDCKSTNVSNPLNVKPKNVPSDNSSQIKASYKRYINSTHPDFTPPKELYGFLNKALAAHPKLQLSIIHNDLRKKFGNELGTKYYRISKEYIKQQY